MLVSLTGGIEEIESSLGHFMPPLKVAEPQRPASQSKPEPVALTNQQEDRKEY
jgi:hypothetical protein